jgi:hypothetical protein
MTDTIPVPESTLEEVLEELDLLVGEGDCVDEDVQDLRDSLRSYLEHSSERTHAVECRKCGILDGYGEDGALPQHKAYRVAGLHEGLETMHSVSVVPLVGGESSCR